MRTTLDLPDDLFRQVKAKAALEGVTLKDLLTRFIDVGGSLCGSAFRFPGFCFCGWSFLHWIDLGKFDFCR